MIRDRFAAYVLPGLIAVAAWAVSAPAAYAQRASGMDTSIAAPPAHKPFAAAGKPVPAPIGDEDEGDVETPLPDVEASAGSEMDEAEDGEVIVHSARADLAEAKPEEDGDMPLDGVVIEREPIAVRDGIPDLSRDPRTDEERGAFRIPPVGYDPYMFQIELDPLRDRRTAELFHLEPYDPIGVRIGGFVIFPEAEIGGIATNNVFRSTPREGDVAAEVRSSIRAVSNWRQHAVELRAAGAASFYDEHPSEDDRSYALEARGRLDITRRTNIEALISHQLDKDVRSSPNSPAAAAERGDVEVDRAAATLNHRFNRLSFQLRAAISDYDYAPVPSVGGGIIDNDDRDYTQRDAAFRTTWDFGRGLGVFVEADLQDRTYDTPPADGILRSSTGEQVRAGISFGPLGSTVRGEVSLGWGRQRPDSPALDDLQGLLIDANLAWRASALTTFLFTAQSSFVDSTEPGSSGGLARLVGLEVRHAFYRRLIGIAGIRYSRIPYDGIDLEERELTAELGADYYLRRETILFGRYQHIDFDSSAPASDYTADIIRIGIRIRY